MVPMVRCLQAWVASAMLGGVMTHQLDQNGSEGESRRSEGNSPKQSAGKFLAFFAVVMVGVAAMQVNDFSQRAELDGYEETTGVGDRRLFTDGDGDGHPDDLWREVCRFNSRVLYRQARTTKSYRDLSMVRVGQTDDGSYVLYQKRKGDRKSRELEVEMVDDLPTYYLRTGDESLEGKGRYLHIGAQKYPKA